MKLPRRPLRVLGRISLMLCAFFFGTAFVGWLREKHDVKAIRAHFREREVEIRSAIAKVGEGVSHQTFKELLPNAYYDKEEAEWIVRIPTGYYENPASTNTFEETEYFRSDGGVVRPVRFKKGIGGTHADRFGLGGVWYYFGRAWYSTVERHQTPSS